MGVHRRWWPGRGLITDIPARCLNVHDVADRLRSLCSQLLIGVRPVADRRFPGCSSTSGRAAPTSDAGPG